METKNIVITGSTRGIGFGLASEFLKRGHHVAINGTSVERVETALEKLSIFNNQLIGIAGNVVDPSTHDELFDAMKQKFGSVDIWINNAGISHRHQLAFDLTDEEVSSVIDINVKGMMLGSLHVVRKMKEQGFGKIFNMAGFGSDGRKMNKMTIYGTSKYALSYFTESLSNEVKHLPIQVGTLSPGMVITDLITGSFDSIPIEEREHTKKIFNILGERVEVVTPYLVEKILKSTKNNDKISFLSGGKVMLKFLKSPFQKNKFFD
jgi:NAD(P)-dependent dehydrogenase (short-subunit alcohol dehydrogenase family)